MIKLEKITEIGVAVRDLEKTTKLLVDVFDGQAGAIYDVPLFGMRFRMVKLGDIDFELMEPLSEDGIIAKHIHARGEGLHHIAFAVDNLEKQVEGLRAKGCKPVNEKPLEIFGAKVVFLHPKDFSGIAFELVEYPEDWKGWFSSNV